MYNDRTIFYGDLSIKAMAAPANALPRVEAFTKNCTTVYVGQPVTFTIAVSDPDADATNSPYVDFKHQVEWFMTGYDYGRNNPTYVTNDTQCATWTNQAHVFTSPGTYSVRAEVMDEWLARSYQELSVTVLAWTPPTCALVELERQVVKAGTNLTLTATAASTVTNIRQVEFFCDGTKIGAATAAPYSCVWSNVPAGQYTLTARATDSVGSVGDSPVVLCLLVIASDAADGQAITGGVMTNYVANGTNYTVHIFSGSAPRTVWSLAVGSPVTLEYLIVGGGGGGGNGGGGGGGGGGGIVKTGFLQVVAGTYAVTVGGGGGQSANGATSSFYTVSASGGGAGGGGAGANCGNGGGGSGGWAPGNTGWNGGTGSDGGKNGGNGWSSGSWPIIGGGGAGMSANGASATGAGGGKGGDGSASSITGVSVTYGGGGGGGPRSDAACPVAAGGAGGGGAGGVYPQNGHIYLPVKGTDGLGGGGGGGGGSVNAGGNLMAAQDGVAGGSGIVILRYATASIWTAYEQWQRLYFNLADLNNLATSGATADPDHDGLSNAQEYGAGTDPTNAASCLVLYALTNNPAAPGEYVVRWQSVSDHWYTVQAATNLLVVGFTNLATHLPATPPVNVHTDNVSGVGCRFYRVQVE
jgi:hypothetical protein